MYGLPISVGCGCEYRMPAGDMKTTNAKPLFTADALGERLQRPGGVGAV